MFQHFRGFNQFLLFIVLATAISVSPKQAAQTKTNFSRQTTDRLDNKRYIAAGDRAYVIGTTDGLFPPMGWHIKGEMGGIWTHPLKLLDGYWFTLNGNEGKAYPPPVITLPSLTDIGAGFPDYP